VFIRNNLLIDANLPHVHPLSSLLIHFHMNKSLFKLRITFILLSNSRLSYFIVLVELLNMKIELVIFRQFFVWLDLCIFQLQKEYDSLSKEIYCVFDRLELRGSGLLGCVLVLFLYLYEFFLLFF
jgi:hypothetical protein